MNSLESPPQVENAAEKAIGQGVSGPTGRWYWGVLGVAVCITLACWSLQSHEKPIDLDNVLEVPEESLNFGLVSATNNFKWKIPITNRSDKPVRVQKINTSCGCTNIEPQSFEIPSNETREINVLLDLSNTHQSSSKTRDFSVTLSPVTDSGNISRLLKGSVYSHFSYSPQRVVYNGASRISTVAKPEPEKIVIKCFEEKTHLFLSCPAALGKVEPAEIRQEQGDAVAYFIPAEKLPPGQHSGEIHVTAKSEKTPSLESVVTIPIELNVIGFVECVPSICDFGACRKGTTQTTRLAIASVNGVPFRIDFKVESLKECTIKYNATEFCEQHTIEIHCPIETKGQAAFSVEGSIQSLDTSEPERLIVPIRYYGTD